MKDCVQNATLTLWLSGHIDSSNAPATEAEIMSRREATPHEAMVLDFKDVNYISSAGLRIVLRLRKLEPQLRLVNVSSEVYEVLEMTGFTEMMPVEKAYREVSIEGCEVIGQGANGTVYRIDKDTAVKVYKNTDCLPDVQRERELARKAFVMGIPTAIPYDVVRVNDRYGSVFELLNSQSFSKLIRLNPENMDHYVDLYVDVMRKMHSTHVKSGDMPSAKEITRGYVEYVLDALPAEQGRKLMDMVMSVPDMDTLVHGDYHTNNIVIQNGEVLIIDMDTLCVGHPIFELGPMYMAYVGFGELDHSVTEDFLHLPYEKTVQFWQKTLRRYLNTDDEAFVRAVEDKVKVLNYMRILRHTLRRDGTKTPQGRAKIELCMNQLNELIPRVDSLSF